MERILGDLLEEMDKKYPYNITIGELLGKGFSKTLLIECIDKGFIDYPHNMQDYGLEKAINDPSMFVVLTSTGFLALNQIRIKKATEKLDGSIKEFDASSKLNSKVIIGLTVAMLILTGIIAWLTLVLVKG